MDIVVHLLTKMVSMSLQVPNGAYDFGAGSNNGYYMSFEYAVELSVNDLVIDFSLTPVSEFDGGIAGIVHLNDGDDACLDQCVENGFNISSLCFSR